MLMHRPSEAEPELLRIRGMASTRGVTAHVTAVSVLAEAIARGGTDREALAAVRERLVRTSSWYAVLVADLCRQP